MGCLEHYDNAPDTASAMVDELLVSDPSGFRPDRPDEEAVPA